jgi:hypothetical protein
MARKKINQIFIRIIINFFIFNNVTVEWKFGWKAPLLHCFGAREGFFFISSLLWLATFMKMISESSNHDMGLGGYDYCST